jgi:hypothetical protein
MTVTSYQSNYNVTPPKGMPGQVANAELANVISRTVESSAGIAFGQPAFRGTGDHGVIAGDVFAGTAVAAAYAGNTGNGVMGAVTVSAGAKAGVYQLVVIEPGSNAGRFTVEDPDGDTIGVGTVGSAFSAGGLAFTLADGATDFVSGDGFTITTTFTADKTFIGFAVLSHAVPANATTPDAYPQYFTGGFMTQGEMYVVAGASVNDGDDVYWNPATSRYTNTTTHVAIPLAKFDTTGVNGDIVEISRRNR